jgi:phosphopantothenoylcysteine decarboxylase/phosphopantothenate--cysteine ligase
MSPQVENALRLAQANAKHFPIPLESLVIFPEEECTAKLKTVNGDTATIYWPDGRTRDVLLNQLALVQMTRSLARARAAGGLAARKHDGDYAGRKVLLTAGPTREHLDPVRFISNPSTGQMGYALARAAYVRGADVTLVSGPVALAPPQGVHTIPVVSADDMLAAVNGALKETVFDTIIMSAAVCDYKPVVYHAQKVKKGDSEEAVPFTRTPDILLTIGTRLAGKTKRPVIIGFAAETENVVEHAYEKLMRKHCDMIVANYVGEGGAFGSPLNEVTLVTENANKPLPKAGKDILADSILDEILRIHKAR